MKLNVTRSVLVKGATLPVVDQFLNEHNLVSNIGRVFPPAEQTSFAVAGSLHVQFYEFGRFRLNATERLLLNGNEPVALGGRAFDVLVTLIERRGEIVDQRELQKRVWPDVMVDSANIRVQVSTLRKALGDGCNGSRYIVNVPGRGYCFVVRVKCTPR